MSNPLQVLLERITPKPKPIPEPKPPSEQQLKLLQRVQNRRWLETEIPLTEENLEGAKAYLRWIKRVPSDSMEMSIIQLGIERYMGSRCPWFLDISQGIDFDDEFWEERPPYYQDCPRATSYELGYYGHSSEDTLRFIKDRLAWAKHVYKQEVKIIRKYLRALKNWDLESELPVDSIFLAY